MQSWNNSIGRYFLATVSYRFQTFGKREGGNGMNYDGFGPGPGGPGGMRPGGPGGMGSGRRF